MQTLFNTYTGPKVGIVIDPNWRYVRSALQRNIAQTTLYYRSRNFSVKNNHVLARFLKSTDINIDEDIQEFYSKWQDKALRISTIFKMTSSLYRGDIFYGEFFGKGSKEIIVATDDYYNPIDLQANWQDIESVKFLDHPKSDTSMLLANGRAYSAETGYSVISVNIPALLVQYKCWLQEQSSEVQLGEGTLSTSVFLHKYVIPNMLNSQIDVVLINRMINMITATGMGVPEYRHAFVLINYDERIDKVLKNQINYLSKTDRDFYTMMREVPLIGSNNLLEFSEIPINAPTRQIAWAEIAARIKIINFLLDVNPSHGKKLSMMQLNYIKRIFDRFNDSRGLEQIPDRGLISDIEAEMIRTLLYCRNLTEDQSDEVLV